MGAVAAEVAAWGEEWASPPKRASSVPVGNAFWRVRFAVVYGTCFWRYQAACNASALLKCGMCAPHLNFTAGTRTAGKWRKPPGQGCRAVCAAKEGPGDGDPPRPEAGQG